MRFVSLTPSVQPSGEGPRDFSLVLGGPLFQLYRRLHLSGESLELPARRIVAVTLFTWAPLFLLSIIAGTAWGRAVKEPFLLDADANARLLIALPLLIGCEVFVHGRIGTAVRQFIVRGIVTGDALTKFQQAERRAVLMRDSTIAELLLLAFVYAIGISVLRNQFAPLDVDTWYRRLGPTSHITAAGWWYTIVSLPLFQFVLFRWYFRLTIWTIFLWRVALCGLKLTPTHPDRSAGLGFLADSTLGLVPFLFAHGVLFAGVMAVGIFFGGRTVMSYGPTLGVFSALALAIALAPLLAFALPLAQARRSGLREYGTLAQGYVVKFDKKWLHSASPDMSQLLGSADIQSLSDMINSYQSTIADMRPIPISLQIAVRLLIATLLPVAPLLLTVMPATEILKMLLKGIV